MNAIETHSLTKHFGRNTVVDQLDWSVPVGSACAFLGPNGAGKSTTLKMLMGFTQPSAGTVSVLGSDPWDMAPEVRARVGYVAENPLLPSWMKVDALIEFHRGLYPRWDAELERRLLAEFGVQTKRQVSQLSKGEHRRLMLFLALCQGGDLLLLDEPGSGLDVAGRRKLLSLLSEYLAEGNRTLVFSTHIVTDVERIASHVAVLNGGVLIAHTDLDELREEVKAVRMPREVYERHVERWSAAGVLVRAETPHAVELTVRRFATHGLPVLMSMGRGDVHSEHGPMEDVYMDSKGELAQVRHLSLEDAFLALTGTVEVPREAGEVAEASA